MSPHRISPHFAAFSFVDRITELTPAKRARGTFAVPAHLPGFSPCFVAEAVGQLAAWVSMAHIDFRGRPVAALASETCFTGDAVPGRVLDLAVDIADCDEETVAYNGAAYVDGRRIVELVDCLGPMLPVADFDSPDALRERFELLLDGGATPGRFQGVQLPEATIVEHVAGASIRATLDVPLSAPFFGDHFPRRAVFPATLLLDTQIRLAQDLARGAPWHSGGEPRAVRVTNVKVRAFTLPGQRLELSVDLAAPVDGLAKATLGARVEGRNVATARLELATSAS
jgi:3-hydroxymyristoyl/3-hydroxydecanoyl-(acyl carrier protein) dehydratase